MIVVGAPILAVAVPPGSGGCGAMGVVAAGVVAAGVGTCATVVLAGGGLRVVPLLSAA